MSSEMMCTPTENPSSKPTKPKKMGKLSKKTRKRLRQAMLRSMHEFTISFNQPLKQYVYTVTRQDCERFELDDVTPGEKFLIPIKRIKIGKTISRVPM